MLTIIIKSISTRLKLIEIVKEAIETYTFKFEVPESVIWTPGSYAHFVSSDLQNGAKFKKDLLRELSIMSNPNEKFIGFTTRIRNNPSVFKQAMLKLKHGDEIRMFKIGNHMKNIKNDKPIVFISMGVGIATFRPLILDCLDNSSQTSFITNINIDRSGDFVYQKELEKLASNKLKNVFVCNRVDLYDNINKCIDNGENIYFIVGSNEFNNQIGDYLVEKNVSKDAIVFDKH